MSDLTSAVKAMDEKHYHYVRARDYYYGRIPEYFGNRRMRRLLQEGIERYGLNMAKTPVNAVANRMEIAAVTVPENPALTTVLQEQVWDANELLFEMPQVIRNTCRDGDGYVLVWDLPGDDEEGVDVTYVPTGNGIMVYSPYNARKKDHFVHLWCEEGERYADVFYADRVEQWYQSEKSEKPQDENAWHERTTAYRFPTMEEDGQEAVENGEPIGVWPLDNPYGEVPAFHFRTDRPWGVPLHFDAYGPQDAITKIVSAHMGTVDYQTFPQRYALEEAGLEGEDLDDADWDELHHHDPEWRSNLSASATGGQHGLRAGSGEVWWLKGVKGVGQFDVADPKVFLDPAEFYIRMMAQTTDTPLHFFDPGGDQPSGESRRAAEGTLVKKVKNLMQSFGFTTADMLSLAMKILGHQDVHVDVRWVTATQVDDKDSWETAGLKIQNGVPVGQVLMEQGYTAEQVEEWLEDTDGQDLTRRVDLLDKIGEAVQKLGAGVGFGVVTVEQVAQVIQGVLNPTEDEPGPE